MRSVGPTAGLLKTSVTVTFASGMSLKKTASSARMRFSGRIRSRSDQIPDNLVLGQQLEVLTSTKYRPQLEPEII